MNVHVLISELRKKGKMQNFAEHVIVFSTISLITSTRGPMVL